MKILVLNGSPKAEKSDCMCMTRSFLEGMKEVTNCEIKIINVIEQKIEYCRGCFACWTNNGKCAIKDDMAQILEYIQDSDLILFSYPLYCYGMPAPLKALVDRVLPMVNKSMKKVEAGGYDHTERADISRLKFLMISGCGFPGIENNFEPAVLQFKRCFRGGTPQTLTVPESPMFNVPQAQEVVLPKLEQIKAAGKEYAETGSISEQTRTAIEEPMIPVDQYLDIVNGNM